MGLDNNLNISELLRRLGVKGNSLGSAPLLESLRLTLSIGDLSDLVPPVGVPLGAASISSTSGVGTVNAWSLASRSPGGLTVERVETAVGNYDVFVTDTDPFGAVAVTAAFNFSFGQAVQSAFRSHTPGAAVAPANVFGFGGAFPSILVRGFDNWVGPGQFFNIEDRSQNNSHEIFIAWKEYPAALNP